MTLAFDDGRCTVHIGHVLEELAALPPDSVHCVVTSPPYWGLRDYKGLPDFTWGGEPEHAHEWTAEPRIHKGGPHGNGVMLAGGRAVVEAQADVKDRAAGAFCACGAWRGQLGLEPTHDLYVAHMVEVFEAVRRVLRPDGTLWLNLGDCYVSAPSGNARPDHSGGTFPGTRGEQGYTRESARRDRAVVAGPGHTRVGGLKPKDLVGIPWRVAFALQAAGWWLRSAITWCKRAPMPESIRDRPTSATEMVFLLTKSETYFYDNLGFTEPSVSDHASGNGYGRPEQISRGGPGQEAQWEPQKTRNMRNYWVLGPEPYPAAHFAVFPTEIPRRAILLGTSGHGVCAACGAPWERVVEKERTFESGSGRAGNLPTGKNGAGLQGGGETVDVRRGPVVHAITTGWQPTCACAADTTPATVLDPFLGSGTTLEVAASLGRRGVGIEGNPTYLPLIEKRLRQGVLL